MWQRQHITHQQIFNQERKNLLRLEDKYVLQETLYKHSCCCHKLTSWSSISAVQMLLCCVCYAPFCQLTFWLDIVSFHVIICRSNTCSSSGFPPHIRISDRKYSTCSIGAPPMFFRADSVTLNTRHTTGKSDKIGTLHSIVGRGEIGSKSARLSCGVYQIVAKIAVWAGLYIELPCYVKIILQMSWKLDLWDILVSNLLGKI